MVSGTQKNIEKTWKPVGIFRHNHIHRTRWSFLRERGMQPDYFLEFVRHELGPYRHRVAHKRSPVSHYIEVATRIN